MTPIRLGPMRPSPTGSVSGSRDRANGSLSLSTGRVGTMCTVLDTIFGLPVHALVVHATVVVVPTTAAAVLVAALWPRFRRWADWGPLALAVLSVILDPISTQSGEALEHRLPRTQLVQEHAHLADGLLPWVIGLLIGSAALYWRGRRLRRGPVGAENPRWVGGVVTVVCVAAALGTLVEVVLIGHSGAVAAWSGVGA
jgi:hypothetical protein